MKWHKTDLKIYEYFRTKQFEIYLAFSPLYTIKKKEYKTIYHPTYYNIILKLSFYKLYFSTKEIVIKRKYKKTQQTIQSTSGWKSNKEKKWRKRKKFFNDFCWQNFFSFFWLPTLTIFVNLAQHLWLDHEFSHNFFFFFFLLQNFFFSFLQQQKNTTFCSRL